METIKFADGIKLHVDGEEEFFPDMQALDEINIPEEFKGDIIRKLICFHTLDLSEAYEGHTVILTLCNKEESNNENI